jgi:hypothetical protein
MAGNTNISETVEILVEKQDVRADGETSLDQQNVTLDVGKSIEDAEPNAEVRTSENNEIRPTDKDKKTATKSQEVVGDSDEEKTIDKEDNIVR